MRLASKGGVDWREREAFRWFRLRKRIRQFLKYRPGCAKTVVFIVGCQRSGTSMLSHLFRLDPDCITYDEVSPLSSRDPEGLRLDPLPEVAARVARDRAPLVVLKPLVESQRLAELLDAVPGSRAVWMFRDHRDVARSNLRFFGRENGLRDLELILAGDAADWRAEGLDPAVRERIGGLHRSAGEDHDAPALFWLARNSLLFRDGLDGDPRVVTCRYEELVAGPRAGMAALYQALGVPHAPPRALHDVEGRHAGKGRDLALTPGVDAACREMAACLDARHRGGVSA